MSAEARRYALQPEDGSAEGFAMNAVVDGHGYDIRRVVAGPAQRHGPGQYAGDACVVVLEGDVRFTVNDVEHALGVHDLLWVPAGARRGFVAGEQGVVLLAIHLPKIPAPLAEVRGA